MADDRVMPGPAAVAPVCKERFLLLPIEAAFATFTVGLTEWWPLDRHALAGQDAAAIRLEAAVGGRMWESTTDGTEHTWADVLAWEPPKRVLLSWHPTRGLEGATTLEVRFESAGDGCWLRLEHRDWEALDAGLGTGLGAAMRAGYDPGWDAVLARFEAYIDGSGKMHP